MLESLMERLLSHIEMVPEAGCWISTYSEDKDGYSRVQVYGKNIFAHRLSWNLHNGPIPKGLFVLHRCDTPSCVNPNHLFLGTQKDNVADCKSKGRTPNGTRHPKAKVSYEDVLKIRMDNRTPKEIAKDFGISFQHVYDIKTKRRRVTA